MTQNTEQNVRTREDREQEIAIMLCKARGRDPFQMTYQTIEPGVMVPYGDAWCHYIPEAEAVLEWHEAEARGAEEQRRKDAECNLRPMSEAKKERTPILAKIHDDLFPRIYPERKDLKCWNGRWVVISHTGILADGFDIGWGVAAPVGCGALTDDWFIGWKPIECTANVAALEAEIASLKEAEQLARADAEASKANAVWNFLTENISPDPKLPSWRLNQMFQEGDSKQLIEETLAAFGIEACWDATQWDWQGPLEEMEELSADDLGKCDPRKDLTDAGWKLVDAWDTEDSEIVRMYVRPIRAALTREGGV